MRISIVKVKVARAVLKAIQRKVRKMPKGDNYLTLDHYQNCREQGFIIVNLRLGAKYPWVAFSENRNSDDIVVYPSTKNDFIPTQGVSDESWKVRKFFRYDDVEGAAAFCVKHLLG